jgi:NTE family protein
LYPLFYECTNQDVVIVQINPLRAEEVPTNAADILDRVNEISFNTTLMREVRAIAFVQKLFTRGKLDDNDPYKDVRLHMIEAEEIMSGLTHSSKLNADWDFLQHLFDVGRQSADDWLHAHYDKIGKETSIDLKETFL